MVGRGAALAVFRRKAAEQADNERRRRLDDQIEQGMRGLGPDPSARLLAFGQSISWLLLPTEGSSDSSERALLLELEQLRPVFLRLCLLQERLGQRLEELRLAAPEQELARLAQAYAAEKDLGLRLTLHQSIKAGQRKLEQQARLVDAQRRIELELSGLEQSMGQLRNQQQLGVPWADQARDVQGVFSRAANVGALEAELSAL